jgi:pyruvate formate lyase activating enzyme
VTTGAAAGVTSPSLRGWIWDVRRCALHDGPGIRTIVFLKGCPLSCLWCCNPETQVPGHDMIWIAEKCLGCDLCLSVCARGAVLREGDGARRITAECDFCGECAERCPGEAMTMAGRHASVDDVLREVERDALFACRSGGGLTLSGGEPLAQPEFASELLRLYRRAGSGGTAVETCGAVPWGAFEMALPHTDLFLYDVKHMDPDAHARCTGAPNAQILDNAKRLAAAGAPIVVRLPLVPGSNDGEENVRQTARFARSLRALRIDLLPYHRLGEPRYARVKRRQNETSRPGGQRSVVAGYPLFGLAAPDAAAVERARGIAEAEGIEVGVGG